MPGRRIVNTLRQRSVARLGRGLALAPDVQSTWYSQGPEGYIDYPEAAPGVA